MSDLSRIIHEAIRSKRFVVRQARKNISRIFHVQPYCVAHGISISRTLRSMLDCHRLKPLWPPKVLWESRFPLLEQCNRQFLLFANFVLKLATCVSVRAEIQGYNQNKLRLHLKILFNLKLSLL